MAKRQTSDDDMREEVLAIIMAGVGLVLDSKSGARGNRSRDRECAVNVLAMLEEDGFKVVRDA